MKVTKLGHCCLLIEIDGVRILTDPGSLSSTQNTLGGIDIILITHEHGDHLHTESLSAILANNPDAEIITNTAVATILKGLDITCTVLEGRDTTERKGISIAAFDGKHEEIYEEVGQVQNTGYFIADSLFYPGDSFMNPHIPVDILALPVAGPWCKIADAIRYALTVKPKRAFPVHDGLIKEEMMGLFHGLPRQILEANGIAFTPMNAGDVKEFDSISQ